MVDRYPLRPPYPGEVIRKLVDLPNRRKRALDLGCGPGKVAAALAPFFASIDAVDPSSAMLDSGQNQHARHSNIQWFQGTAEAIQVPGNYDLVVAATSFHWMDPQRVIPKIGGWLAPGGLFAVVSGDAAEEPPWRAQEIEIITRYLWELRGLAFNAYPRPAKMVHHPSFHARGMQKIVSEPVTQTVEHYIASQHSRQTWATSQMGPELTERFDRDLREILTPFANDDRLTFRVGTRMEWGVIPS